MASGYNSIHPIMAKNLGNIDVPSAKVTQGWGYAEASAGFHSPEGWIKDNYGTHRYSSCVDLSASLGFTSELKSRLISAGFCPFFRNWSGNKHIHCVYNIFPTILSGPKTQIVDYFNGKNGLVGHAPMTGELAPTDAERQIVKAAFLGSNGHNTVTVKIDDNIIDCYAFMEKVQGNSNEITRCELRTFVEYFDGVILSDTLIKYDGKTLNYTVSNPQLEGDFTRVNLREIANIMSITIDSFSFDGVSGIAILKG